MVSASTASVAVSKVRRSILEVSHAVTGEPMQSMIAPNVISSPAVRMLISRPEDNSPSMPAGASTEQPMTMLPSMSALGAKRRSAWTGIGTCFMHMHVRDEPRQEKAAMPDYLSLLS